MPGIDLLDTLSPDGSGDRDALRHARRARRHFDVADDDDWSDIFSKLLAPRVEPRLGMERPCILYEYPRLRSGAGAAPSPRDARVAERFELYACGVELANGFGELTDPDEQRARFDARHGRKRKESMASAIRWTRISWPPWRDAAGQGVALGFDRLVMLATGAPNIDAFYGRPRRDAMHGRHARIWGGEKPPPAAFSRRHD